MSLRPESTGTGFDLRLQNVSINSINDVPMISKLVEFASIPESENQCIQLQEIALGKKLYSLVNDDNAPYLASAKSLAILHALGWTHGDFYGDNIFYNSENGQITIIDNGNLHPLIEKSVLITPDEKLDLEKSISEPLMMSTGSFHRLFAKRFISSFESNYDNDRGNTKIALEELNKAFFSREPSKFIGIINSAKKAVNRFLLSVKSYLGQTSGERNKLIREHFSTVCRDVFDKELSFPLVERKFGTIPSDIIFSLFPGLSACIEGRFE